MLGKLLKYDMKSMSKSLLPLYLITLGMAIICRLVLLLSNQISIFKGVSALVVFFFCILLIGVFLYTFVLGIKRFYNNLMKDEGYLTHTLPVPKYLHLNSKIIASLIFLVFSTIIVILAFCISFYYFGMFDALMRMLTEFSNAMSISLPAILCYVIITLLLGYLSNLLLVYVSLALGHLQNKNRLVFAVVYGIVVYTISQIVSLIALTPCLIVDPGLLATNATPAKDILMPLLGISLGVSILLIIAYYLITLKILKKNLNLE